MPELEA